MKTISHTSRQHYAKSTKAFLEVLHKGRRAELRLRETRVKVHQTVFFDRFDFNHTPLDSGSRQYESRS
jgi:hypothetical protein